MRICDWSSVVCSSDLIEALHSACPLQRATNCHRGAGSDRSWFIRSFQKAGSRVAAPFVLILPRRIGCGLGFRRRVEIHAGKVRLQTEAFKESRRSEEHTSELQSLMRISYAVFCLKKKTINNSINVRHTQHS